MTRIVGAWFVASLFLASCAFADLPGAQKFLDQAKQQLAENDANARIEATLQSAEAELADVPPAEKEPLLKEIAAVRTLMADGDFVPRLIRAALFFLAAFAVLLKSRFARLAGSRVGAERAGAAERNLNITAVVFLFFGILGLVRGSFYAGLLGNVALLAAGVFLSLDMMERQAWWKPGYSPKLRACAVPIALVCVAVGILRLIPGVPAFL